jgi:hypothetical protein
MARPGLLAIDTAGKEPAFISTGPTGRKGMFEDWKGNPSNVGFGIGGESDIRHVSDDKSLHRIRLKTRGFHPQLAGK